VKCNNRKCNELETVDDWGKVEKGESEKKSKDERREKKYKLCVPRLKTDQQQQKKTRIG